MNEEPREKESKSKPQCPEHEIEDCEETVRQQGGDPGGIVQQWLDKANKQATKSRKKISVKELEELAKKRGEEWEKAHPNGPVPSSPHSISSLELSSGNISGTSYVSSSRESTSSGQKKRTASSMSPYRHPASSGQQNRQSSSKSSGRQSSSSGRDNRESSPASKSKDSMSSGQHDRGRGS